MKKKQLGFTLVELMISISIIAILSVVLSMSFSKAQKDGRDRRRVDDLKAIQNAAEQYYSLSGGYPTSAYYAAGQKWTASGQTVLESYPKDPKSTGSYVYKTVGTVNTSTYCVCVAVENPNNANAAINGTTCDLNSQGGYFCIKNQQ